MSMFFVNVKKRRSGALVHKFVRDLESGVFATPKSFDVLNRYRTEELKLDQRSQAVRLYLPENQLILAFCKAYPQAKAQAIALQSFQPPLAKQFALRQLQVMRTEGLPLKSAFEKVEKEMAPQIAQLMQTTMGSSISQLQLIQQEEEHKLKEAATAMLEGKAPPMIDVNAADALNPIFRFGEKERRHRPHKSSL